MTTTLELVPQTVGTAPTTRTWVAPVAAAGAGVLAAVAAVAWLLSSVAVSAPVGVPGF
jgi:hypothetical protein